MTVKIYKEIKGYKYSSQMVRISKSDLPFSKVKILNLQHVSF